MAYAFRRAARSTLTTSATTAAAFFANAFNPIMPMASFGIYAAILILVVYSVMVLFFPPLVIFYERHLMNCCKCCCKKLEKDATNESASAPKEKGMVQVFFGETLNNCVKKFKYVFLVVFIVWTIAAFILAS